MKSVAALGLLAALASASKHLPRHYYPLSNSTTADPAITSAPAAGSTTLTVVATSVHTVISCAPTVTDCPARANQTGMGSDPAVSTIVTTDTVVLSTTVCPVESASSISSSIVGAHSSGLITGTTMPPSTATSAVYQPPAPYSSMAPGSSVTYGGSPAETSAAGDETSSTTLTSTSTATMTRTVHVPPTDPAESCDVPEATSSAPDGDAGNVPATTSSAPGGDESNVPATTSSAPGGDESNVPATTTSAPGGDEGNVPATTSSAPGAGATYAPPNDGGDGCNVPPVTVTVTSMQTVQAPASTIYVTMSAECSTTEAQPAVTSMPSMPPPPPSDGEDCSSSDTVTSQTTVTVPYPTGNNGTYAEPTASGFTRYYR